MSGPACNTAPVRIRSGKRSRSRRRCLAPRAFGLADALISRAMSSTPGSSTTMSISSRPPFLRRWYTRRRRELVAISGRSCAMTNVSIVRPASRCCPKRRRRRLRAPRPSWRHPRRSASATWSGGQAGCRPRQTWSPPRSCSVWTNLQHRFGSTLSIGLGQSRLWL